MFPKTEYGQLVEDTDGFEFPLSLPEGFSYIHERFSWLEEQQGSFVCEFRVSVLSTNEFTEWKQAFESLTMMDLKTRRGATENGRSYLYQDTFICQHAGGNHSNEVTVTNKKGDPRRTKRIQCPTVLWMGLRRITDRMARSYSRLHEYPTWVKIKWNHNHASHCSTTLSHRRISNITLSNLREMFLEGLTWQEAYQCCRSEVELRHADASFGERSLESALADSSICPTKRQVRYRFAGFDEQLHGQRNGSALWDHVETFCHNYNEVNGASGGAVRFHRPVTRGEEFVIAISTPVMTRVRQNCPSDCRMCFIDSTGSVDTQSATVTFVMAGTCVGALPIGLIIAGEKTELAYGKGFSLLRDLTADIESVSKWEPSIAMTDNDSAIRNGLKQAFPHVRSLLCLFHILQQVWRYLFSKQSEMSKDSRVPVMKAFKKCVYATEAEFPSCVHNLLNHSELSTPCRRYFNDLMKTHEDWALHYRKELITRGQNTNNYCEASVRMFKEGIMSRVKSRSLGHLLRICAETMDAFYCSRLLDFSHQRTSTSHLYRKTSGAYLKSIEIPKHHYTFLGSACFTCKSMSKNCPQSSYTVDMKNQLCDCPEGTSGKLCKHVYACSTHFNIELLHLPPQTAETRQMLARIAHGSCEEVEFYRSLIVEPELVHCQPANPDSAIEQGITHSDESEAMFHETTEREKEEVEVSPTTTSTRTRVETAAEYVRRISCAFISVIGSNDVDIPDSLLQALGKFAAKTEEITTRSGLENLLFESILYRYSKGRRMPVQPTSIARRKRENGSRSQQIQGRTPSALQLTSNPRPTKRAHCLKTAVLENRPNARKH